MFLHFIYNVKFTDVKLFIISNLFKVYRLWSEVSFYILNNGDLFLDLARGLQFIILRFFVLYICFKCY